jgi:G3E family GTPase
MAVTKVSIIAGFLGSGKTSVIRHLLSQRHDNERVAVLVNEIGDVGIDGDLIQEVSGAACKVRELAGGCICCTANLPFRQAVVELLRQKPDRLIIEPTGVAAVTSVRDVFAETGIAPSVELDPVVVLVDPRQWENPKIQSHPLYIEQREAADVLVMSHLDCCDDELIQRFIDAHQDKPLTRADFGKLAALEATAVTTKPAPDNAPPQGHLSKGIAKRILTWEHDESIPLDQLKALWFAHEPPTSLLRCKGVFPVGGTWVSVQADAQHWEVRPTAASQRARMVCIILDEPEAIAWYDTLKEGLAAVA